MIRDMKRLEGMTCEEIMYVVAKEYVDDILFKLVDDASKIMSANETLRDIICQAAVNILYYEERRKDIALGKEKKDCFYDFAINDVRAYKTVLYNSLFHKYGANQSNV